MLPSRFDLAIVGDSQAARMVAALLCKRGKRLLVLASPRSHPPWHHASLFLDKLLAILGGQSCRVPCQAFQVLSPRARLTIHPAWPLADELQREFGGAAEAVGHRLAELAETGQRLEELLWEIGGLPGTGVREMASWHWLCLRRKFPLARLATPLAKRLQDLPAPAAAWLTDLFQGLALQPLAALTLADGALLWAQANQPQGIDGQALSTLLSKRCEQFHGVEAGLAELTALEYHDGKWRGTLRGGSSFQAGQLLLADLGRQLPGHGFTLPLLPMIPPRQLVTTALDGQLSSLLEQQVIVGGPMPLCLTVERGTAGVTLRVSAGALGDEAQIRQQLAPALPFVGYTLQALASNQSTLRLSTRPTHGPALFRLPLRLGNQLWCADETSLLPHLGLGGAALLAWTLVRQLDPTARTGN